MAKSKIKIIAIMSAIFISFILTTKMDYTIKALFNYEEYNEVIENMFKLRNKALLTLNKETILDLYDTNTKYGQWALEHEVLKMKYLDNWSKKQGVLFNDIKTKTKIFNIKVKQNDIVLSFLASTEYKYKYKDDKENIFRIGTYHYMTMKKVEDRYVILKEWYTDPFADSMHLDDLRHKEINEYISIQNERDLSNLNERRIKLVEYADEFCGAASDEKFDFKYNKKYINYNPQGGDCANFASQMLYEGAGFKKNSTWNYDKEASKAWVNAQAFKDYMIYSGRASLISYGTYDKVYKLSYKLLPGDFVAYEKKGKVTHISVITGQDSKGYALVNCHNTDRYRVPWDLGWSDKGIKFYLVRVHY